MSGLANPLKWLVNILMGYDDNDDYAARLSLTKAISYPPVFFALNKLVGDYSRLPIDIKKVVKGGAENDMRHDGYKIFREEPNPVQTPSVFKACLLTHAIMYGNGRAAIIREGEKIKEVIPMLPDRTATGVVDGVKFHITKPTQKTTSHDLMRGFVERDDETLMFYDDDVIHIPGFTYDGVVGVGLLNTAPMTISLGLDAQKQVAGQMKKGFIGKLFIKIPEGRLREEAKAKEFIDAVNKFEGGSDNAGKIGLLREGATIESVGHSNQNSQLLELRKFSRQDVGMLFGFESMPGDGESVSYNSKEQTRLSYYDVMDVWLLKTEEELDKKCRTYTQKLRRSHYYKFNRGAILRTDFATSMTSYCNAITHRIMSPNEAREKMDMNPYEGGDTYENPAVTPGSPGQTKESSSASDPSTTNNLAQVAMLQNLMQREANDAISGTKRKNFVTWIENFYAKWEPKLADQLEAIGMDRDLSRVHCEESREILLDVAGNSTPETLENNVKNAVSNWKNRAFALMEGGIHA